MLKIIMVFMRFRGEINKSEFEYALKLIIFLLLQRSYPNALRLFEDGNF